MSNFTFHPPFYKVFNNYMYFKTKQIQHEKISQLTIITMTGHKDRIAIHIIQKESNAILLGFTETL